VPIITPGQSGVLGIGTARECPVIRDGAVAVGKVMTATLSGDHRALDGAQGAEFLRVFRELIEDPARLIV
jgi:pyruvate dehydrogenase E2 component (dihydrolipoamide acetyltransferase)